MKRMIGILGIGVLMLTQMPVMEVNATTAYSEQEVLADDNSSSRNIVTKWYYRTYNGVQQKRLWSVTDGKWLTDWINC